MKKIIAIIIVTSLLTACGSSKYYKGCDGKRKFRTQMN